MLMRKNLIIGITLLLSIVLTACNGENDEANSETANKSIESNSNNSMEGSEKSGEDNKNDDTTNNETTKSVTKDQLELGIGDTGKFDTTIGKFEVTLDKAKVLEELDGESSQLDVLILMDLTVKNTSDETQLVEDLLESTVASDDVDATGSSNSAEYFDSVEALKGELAPEEEISGQFIADVYESDEYYLMQRAGTQAAETSNQVIWTIPAEKAE